MTKAFSSGRLLPVLLLLFPLLHCAYFNSYYNAQTAYDSAYREHRKQMKQSPDSIPTPTGTALSNYDRALEKSAKVLQVYPKDKHWLDDATFLMGKAYFYKGELPKAIRRFKDLQEEYPGSPFIPESYLLLGHAYLRNGDLSRAEEVLLKVLDTYPLLNKNEEVSMLLAKIAIQREGKVLAIELLEKIRKSVRSDEKKLELILQTSKLYADLKQYSRAIALLKDAPRKPNLPALMYRVDYLLLTCYIESDSLAKATELANLMLKNKEYELRESQITLKKAIILDKTGKFDEALNLYDRVTKGSDSAQFAGEAYFAMAVIYQKAKGDLEKAKEYYQKAIAKLKDPDMLALANKRIKALDQLAALCKQLPTQQKKTLDTTGQVAAVQYKISELFWLDLEEPDSAYAHFSDMVADTVLNKEMRSKALYAEGYIALNAYKDTAKADSIFDLLVKTYPDIKYSRKAQEDRGRPVTVITREDSAWEAFDSAEKAYFDQDDAIKGAEGYLNVYKTYPDCEAAPQSLFTAAWISDNVLFKKKTAKSLYEKLCTEYQESDYCIKEAKPKLKIALDSLAARKNKEQQKEAADQKKKTVKQSEIKPVAPLPDSAKPADSSWIKTDSIEIKEDLE
jgi:TolA-binding protein